MTHPLSPHRLATVPHPFLANACVLVVAALPACSSSSAAASPVDAGSPAADAGSDAPARDAGAPEASGRSTITLSGVITSAGSQAPVAGAKVCQYVPAVSPPSCVTTGPDGSYALPLPANTSTGITNEAPGFSPEIEIGTTTGADAVLNTTLLPTTLTAQYASMTGNTLDPSKGQLVVSVFGPNAFVPDAGGSAGLAGSTVSVSPSSGAGPYYANALGVPDPTVTSTTTNGLSAFVNVDPGEPVVSIVPSSGTCTPYIAWPAPGHDSATALVVAGFLTHVSLGCR